MISIKKSPTADTRNCDVTTVTQEQLLESSSQHIGDVMKALTFFMERLSYAANDHDWDKLEFIAGFYADFQTKFKETRWWDKHLRISRHHLNYADGVPEDVNLLDVLEYIADCVMAGMGRRGSAYETKLDDALLQRAFKNTVELLKAQVSVVEIDPPSEPREEAVNRLRTGFVKELECLINKHSMENGSNTPDFILTDYLMYCLETFNNTTNRRSEWYARVGTGRL